MSIEQDLLLVDDAMLVNMVMAACFVKQASSDLETTRTQPNVSCALEVGVKQARAKQRVCLVIQASNKM